MQRVLDIAVCGGGIAGLATALLLTRAGHRVRVHERDADADARDQGGSIGIDGALGRVVLRRMGLDAAFAEIAHPEAAVGRLVDAAGTVLRESPGVTDSGDAEVERPHLRRLLLDRLPPGTVEWGHRVRALEDHGGRVRLRFDDDTEAVADLVVGADGAWSRVRAAVGGTEPVYSGITFLDRRFPDVERDFPRVAETIGRGTLFGADSGLGLIAQRIGRNARVYVAFRAELARVRETPVQRLRAGLETAFDASGWAPSLLELVSAGAEPGTVRPVFEHPAGHRWASPLAATLVGDAAHLQSPFCALGTNGALLDAADLADALDGAATVDEALVAYEAGMWRRAAPNAAAAHRSLRWFMHDDSPGEYLRRRDGHTCRPAPSVTLDEPWAPGAVAARWVTDDCGPVPRAGRRRPV